MLEETRKVNSGLCTKTSFRVGKKVCKLHLLYVGNLFVGVCFLLIVNWLTIH